MDRRTFVARGAVVTGGAIALSTAVAGVAEAAVRTAKTVTAGARGGQYTPNLAPLKATPFLKLPPGAVQPRGWIRTQLNIEADGLCGRMTEVSDYLQYNNCGWVDKTKGAWEELPYWLRGFGDLGYVTGNTRILTLARQWIDGIIANQASDGFFGPNSLRTSLENGPDFWPHMPLLDALRSFAEYSGDSRIVPFMRKYFQFQNAQPAAVFNRSWAALRWGDNIDSVYWLYNRTGESWLLDLVRKIHAGSADYTNGIPNWHNVNLAQGFREPAQFGLLDPDPKFPQATYNDYNTVMSLYGGFPGGGFAGDENCRTGYTDPRQGFETCGIVEFMHSHQMLARMTGDSVWLDRCEDLAFNSLPAALDPAQQGVHYITCANSIALTNATLTQGQFQNGFPMLAYMTGIHNYRCCPHNYGMGWPYYAQELWFATWDNGLCAAMYGASQVTAKVGANGTTVTIVEDTDYPFGDTVTLTVSTPGAVSFPLYLRIPGWSTGAQVRVNGTLVSGALQPGSFVILDQTFNNGDSVTVTLPMRTTVRTWARNGNAISVDNGPLTFSLSIAERWQRIGGTDAWPSNEVYANSAWNYGLLLDPNSPSVTVTRKPGPLAANPFTRDGAPISLTVTGRKIPNWQADAEGIVRTLQQSPARSTQPNESVTLLPMGAQRVRITTFPRVSDGADAIEWSIPATPSASWCWGGDSVGAINDGKVPGSSGDQSVPRMTWWDHLGTSEWAQLTYATPINTGAVSLYWFDDTGVGQCRVPQSWQLQYLNASGQWTAVSGASAYGTALNTFNRVTFNAVTTTALRVVVQLKAGVSSGILEWLVEGTTAPISWKRIQNKNSLKVLGVAGMSTANSANVVQFDDNGTADHNWRLIDAGSGWYKIQNQNSGKLLAVQNMSQANSAFVQQYDDNGSADHLWRLIDNGDGWYRIQVQHSMKVLGVSGMSTANSAQVVQFDDNGTADHLWKLL
ncbi:RICIN domain-containing protein [Dactylosporangium sp. NPDC048998]|uniref:RICIN domain-containing protein n=1 Tax=Dactylosporangium sp. NPDC048998 TaxID=3363976 RepID=UPI0037210169